MIEISNVFWLFAGILAGILAGLLPSVNMALPIMLLFPFIDSLTVLDIFLFWAAVIIGSQYFGSVSVLTTNIPGETSSLVYLDRVRPLGLRDRLQLIRSTALGSAAASIMASLLCCAVVFFVSVEHLFLLNRVSVKAVIFAAIIALLVATSPHRLSAAALLILGTALGIRNNYSLPMEFYPVQEFAQDTTFFMIMLGTLLIPMVISGGHPGDPITARPRTLTGGFPWSGIFKGSAIGSLFGLIPGPSATMAGAVAFRSSRGTYHQITAAESANNAAVISGMLPLLMVGIPLAISDVLVLQLLQIKLIEWPPIDRMPDLLHMILTVQAVCIGLAVLYAWLSTRFLPIYRHIILWCNDARPVFVLLVLGLCVVDWWASDIGMLSYTAGLALFVVLGLILKKYRMDPTPLLFGVLLGDQMVWTFGHLISFYL